VTLSLGSLGAYSGRVQMGTNAYGLSGKVGLDGSVQASVKRKNASPLSLAFRLDLTNGTERLAGIVSDGFWSADLQGGRGVPNPGISAAFRKKFTFLIPSTSPEAPAAPGFGFVSLDDAGRMRLVGSLSDGTPITQAVPLFKDGDWPVYVPLYGGMGVLIGWLHFETTGVNNPIGALHWIRPAQSLAKRFPAGFTNEAPVAGTLYLPVTNFVQFGWTNGLIAFSGSDLTGPFTNRITLLPSNRVQNNSANLLSLRVSLATGNFSGSVRPPGTDVAVSFQGVLQNLFGQSPAVGYGYFLGSSHAGTVVIQPAAPPPP